MRRDRGVTYSPKNCAVCGEEYTPTSGRQIACLNQTCQRVLHRQRVDRKMEARRSDVARPTEKSCEWDGCGDVFSVSYTGVTPKWCPTHRKENSAPGAREATAIWRQKTIDITCEHPTCDNLQHPNGRGWCFFHYPILSMHGLSSDGWWAFYNDQQGCCPICEQPLLDGRTIAVDHDHSSAPTSRHDAEHVRGLLHAAPCNGMIVGGVETAIRNGWLKNVFCYIKYPLSESN